MASLKGSQTEKNILTAFLWRVAGPQQVHLFRLPGQKRRICADPAYFRETANQEKEHAKRLFKLLEGGEVGITATFRRG